MDWLVYLKKIVFYYPSLLTNMTMEISNHANEIREIIKNSDFKLKSLSIEEDKYLKKSSIFISLIVAQYKIAQMMNVNILII